MRLNISRISKFMPAIKLVIAPVKHNPRLTKVLFLPDGTLTASNLGQSLRIFGVATQFNDNQQRGVILSVDDIVRWNSEPDVDIETIGIGHIAKFTSGSTQILEMLDPENFVTVPTMSVDEGIEDYHYALKDGVIIPAINNVLKYAKEGTNRHSLDVVLFETIANNLHITATDQINLRHETYRNNEAKKDQKIFLPSTAVKIWIAASKTSPGGESRINFRKSLDRAVFISGSGYEILTNLSDTAFPNYLDAFAKYATVESQILAVSDSLDLFKRIFKSTKKEHRILRLENLKLSVNGSSFPCKLKCSDPIGLDCETVLGYFKALEKTNCKVVEIKISGPKKPVILKDDFGITFMSPLLFPC